jgi:FlaA1/EpsC-like NDP-sugar epimerase
MTMKARKFMSAETTASNKIFSYKIEELLDSVYNYRTLLVLATYGLIAAFAYTLAFLLRFEFQLGAEEFRIFVTTIPVVVAIRIFLDYALKISHRRLRFASARDALMLGLVSAIGTVGLYLLSWVGGILPPIPRSVLILEWTLSTYLVATFWIVYRRFLDGLRHYRSEQSITPKRALVVGAGEAGHVLAREMQRTPTGYRPVGFLDDDPSKWGTIVAGLTVLGPTDELSKYAKSTRAEEIVVAIPSADPAELRRIVNQCEAADLSFMVLPGIRDVVAGNVRLHQLRPLRIEDLLGREPVNLELPELQHDLNGRAVLITGAAGSIGSELARQVALHDPAVLLLVDQAETPLFELEMELREAHPDVSMRFLVADITDAIAVDRIFRDYAPSRVFHAAAYKHVSLMQVNARQAVRNNVLGSWTVADAAGRYAVEKFVLVSTDKAVRPTSVMGASKRLAEMAVLELMHSYPDTSYAAVRFGNVLGSAGSVIPIFQKQIQQAKPLTVTHPEVSRYFMTIPEAVQLILQTSLLPEVQGNIAMLEMGEPVRILDLARNLLKISGLHRQDYQIHFTGLRPGEKLHEELLAPDERLKLTSNTKVRIVAHSRLSVVDVQQCIADWENAFAEGDDASVVQSMASIFPGLKHHVPARTHSAEAVAVRS